MAHRINVILDDLIWKSLQEVPKGERSRLVNQALGQVLESSHRRNVSEKMDALRKRMPIISTDEIVSWVRGDRNR